VWGGGVCVCVLVCVFPALHSTAKARAQGCSVTTHRAQKGECFNDNGSRRYVPVHLGIWVTSGLIVATHTNAHACTHTHAHQGAKQWGEEVLM
jgi:hypothetical protein